MITKKKIILFDLDGVLIDSKQNMLKSWKKVQKNHSIEVKFIRYFENIGIPFRDILKKLKIDKNIKQIEKTYKEESLNNLDNIKIFSGVINLLKYIKKKRIKIGIVTSKDKERTLKIIKKLKVDFNIIVCPSKYLRGKPYPDQINKALKKFSENKKYICYVGDTKVDSIAAKRAGVDFIFASYGYGSGTYKETIRKVTDLKKFI
jgi:HAD superfamily hydrolase (TIGR01549 family)